MYFCRKQVGVAGSTAKLFFLYLDYGYLKLNYNWNTIAQVWSCAKRLTSNTRSPAVPRANLDQDQKPQPWNKCFAAWHPAQVLDWVWNRRNTWCDRILSRCYNRQELRQTIKSGLYKVAISFGPHILEVHICIDLVNTCFELMEKLLHRYQSPLNSGERWKAITNSWRLEFGRRSSELLWIFITVVDLAHSTSWAFLF